MDFLDTEWCIDAVSRCSMNTSTQFYGGHSYRCRSLSAGTLPYGVFTLPASDSDANGDTDSYTEKDTMDTNEMAPRSVLHGYRTHLSQPRFQSRSMETHPNIIIKPKSLCLGIGIGIGISVGHCK